MRLWAVLQTIRTAFWFTHAWPAITAITLAFPAFQLLVVAECIWRAGYLFPKGTRGGFHAWCWLIGAGAALLAVAQSPKPYPVLSPFAFQLKLALHILGLAALLASLAYTWLIRPSHDPLGVRTRLAWVLYLGASVASNRVSDPALYEAYTVGTSMAQTIAVILLISAFSRFHPGNSAGSSRVNPHRGGGIRVA